MGERRGTKGLELWCRRMTEGYPGVKIDNMTTSWRDGLAFCAIIHHFRPELIDFSKLKKNDVYYNNDLAFTIAEKYLGIPALLEAADMVQYDVPDRLSILTYLSQFYRAFVASQGSTPTRIVPKRPATASERGIVSPASTSPPTKMVIKSGGMPRRDPCAKCGLPVFIAERLNVGKLLYHRTCFRCARCNSQLTLANYYETETQNQFCCETCPDEEIVKKSNVEPKAIVVGPSLSDEEKSANFQKPDEGDDDYSTRFETALDSVDLSKSETLSSVKSAEFSRARSHFVASQIEISDSDEEMPPELPKTKPPDIKSEEPKLKSYGRSEIADFSDNSIVNNVNYELNSGLISNTRSLVSDVNNSANVSNQLKAASLELCKDNDVTKEIQSTKEERPSLVKSRSRLFEKQTVSKEPSTPNVGITAKLFKKSPIERSKLSQSTGNIFVPQKSVLKSPENIYDRRRSLSDVPISLLQKQSSVDKRISTSPKAPIAQKYPSLSSIFQKQSGAEKRKSSPLPEKRSTVSPTKISLDQKYPFGVSSSSKSNPEKSLNSLLQKQISKKLKTSLPDLTKTVKNEDQRVFETPQKFKQLGTNNHSYSTRDLSRQNSEKSRTSRNKFNNEKNVPKEATNGKFVGVSALKNIFEKSSSKVNKKFEKPDDNYSKSVQPVNLEPIECATIDSDINNFSERPQMAIDEALGNENLTQSSKIDEIQDASIDAKCDEKSVVETDSFENENFHLKKDDNTRSETAQIVQDEIKTRSDSNNFVNLVVSSEITEVKHTEQENVSHCNEDNIQVSSEESIQIISEDIPIVIIDDITSDSNENEAITISDDVIEISDASHDEVVIEVSDKSNKNQDYPEDLNPFDDDEEINVNHKSEKSLNPFDDDVESEQTRSPKPKTRSPRISTKSETSPVAKEEKSLNPFDDEEDDDKMDESLPKTPKPVARRKIHANELKNIFESHTDTPEHLQNIYIQRISINPFDEKGDDSATKDDVSTFKSPYPVDEERPRKLKVISAPRDSLNPFWSEDEGDENDDVSKPIPKPRKSKNSSFIPEPKPRTSGQATSSSHGSSTSISSANSGGQTLRKKKPAPRPPIIISEITDSGHSSLTSSPSTSVQHSPRATPKTRKSKKAPLPPTSTPLSSTLRPLSSLLSSNVPTFSPIHDEHPQENLVENENSNNEWEKEKIVKDEVNRTRQSQYFTPPSPPLSHKDYACYTPNKSTYGKWKRKKGPAPSRPVPQKRLIKALPTTEIRRELDLIELQQQGLEKQGVRLEQIIRDRCEGPENNIEDSVPIDVEDLILQLFEVVNEKNELCRRQAELMYLQRQQRLEEEHADVEYQIRCLMLQPEANKTDSDKAREEELINRLVDIVERRNEIIECLEMDRVREAEEDDSICNSLNTYASKRDENLKSDPEILSKKEKKKLKKEKKNKSKNAQNIDIDKDVDESESSIVHSKDKKKKKFALF